MFGFMETFFLGALLAAQQVLAQDPNQFYTVWSSVVFTRTGDRTPLQLTTDIPTLTSLGAQQVFDVGAFLRSRYLGQWTNNGVDSAPLQGLSTDVINIEQVYIGTPDFQYTAASAQAFLQGFYPPTNATSTLANGTQVEGPLSGYQYPLIQTYSTNDPESVYLSAYVGCNALAQAIDDYENSAPSLAMNEKSADMYHAIGSAFLEGVLPEESWNYYWAWPIWDYINYQNTHDVNVSTQLTEGQFVDLDTGTTYLELLKAYSDQQIMGWYGDLYATNDLSSQPFSASLGSISTVAGNFLASQLLGQLQAAVSEKAEYYKLNLLFGDFQPLTSFFTLTSLPLFDTDFYGMPDFGSVMVFELFSYTDGSGDAPFPAEEDLFVKMYFRNGTDGEYTSYGLFGLGPDMDSLTWSDFNNWMYTLVPGSDGDWCSECASDRIFCAYYNASQSSTAEQLTSRHGQVGPVIAGVIGALVTLAVAALIFLAVMLFAGLRFHRVYRQKTDVGGYKGSQKLASDKDLVLPKDGAVVHTEETPGSPMQAGHERVGSWELKQNEANVPNVAAPGFAGLRRPSHEEDDLGAAPWQKPVQPDERV